MLLNKHQLNTSLLNIDEDVSSGDYGTFEGTLFSLRQQVGIIAPEQSLFRLRQSVVFRSTFEGTLFSLRQKVVHTIPEQSLFSLRQRVVDHSLPTFFEKWGWDCEVLIGSYRITTTLLTKQNGLHGEMSITIQEGQARNAVFTIIPPETTIDPQQFQGQRVIINAREASTGWYTVFTGWVDVPELNFLERKITFRCTDRRADRIIKLGSAYVDSIGSYSEDVFGKAQDKADELEKRLETVTSTVDFDNYGNVRFTPWLAKTNPDFTYGNSDIFYTNVDVKYTNRAKTINRINLTLNYSYERQHQQNVSFTWNMLEPNANGLKDWFLTGKPSFASRDMVYSSATQGSWKMTSHMTYVPLWPAQGVAIGEGFGIWQPDIITEETKGREAFLGYLLDSEGNFVTAGNPPKKIPQYIPVLDANGKQIQDVVKRTITDNSSHLCIGAQWRSGLRFNQTVTEKYQMTLKAPQNVTKFGYIDAYDEVSIQDSYDASQWEKAEEISFTNNNFYINKDTERQRMLRANQVMLNRARAQLIKLNRDVVVSFRCKFLKPQLDLHHTVRIAVTDKLSSDSNNAHLTAKGKVGTITHTLNFDSTEAYTSVELNLSKADGTTTDTTQFAVLVPTQDPSYIGTAKSIVLQTHLGLDPNPDVTPGAEKWTGFIGNKAITDAAQNTNRTTFPESFVVLYPEIPAYLRDQITYTSSADNNEFNIKIPDDELDVSF